MVKEYKEVLEISIEFHSVLVYGVSVELQGISIKFFRR